MESEGEADGDIHGHPDSVMFLLSHSIITSVSQQLFLLSNHRETLQTSFTSSHDAQSTLSGRVSLCATKSSSSSSDMTNFFSVIGFNGFQEVERHA